MLGKAAEFYEDEVDEAVKGLSSLMEPFIIVILGALIGGIVVSMYLPIFKLGAGGLIEPMDVAVAERPALAARRWPLLGLCIGSFLNVVIHRLPLMLERGWKLRKRRAARRRRST